MKAATHTYMWEDNPNQKSKVLTAPRYVKAVLDQAQKYVNDPRVFPRVSGHAFPPNFLDLIKPVGGGGSSGYVLLVWSLVWAERGIFFVLFKRRGRRKLGDNCGGGTTNIGHAELHLK